MQSRFSKENHTVLLLIVGLLGWLIPGAGYFVLNEKKRAIIVFTTIVLTFCTGLYIGSIGVIDPIGETPWYIYGTQIMNSPMVALLGRLTAAGGFPTYGNSSEIGRGYTSIAGLLNLLCIVNAVYLAYLRRAETVGG